LDAFEAWDGVRSAGEGHRGTGLGLHGRCQGLKIVGNVVRFGGRIAG
jgi:hypothetical protein